MSKGYCGPTQYGTPAINKFVDLNGRIVAVLEEEDSGEIYVSLTELKKSGFELFEAGRLPNPGGYLRHMTDLQISQFDLYMKMKAAKYLSRVVTTMTISAEHIDNTIQEEKNYYQLGLNSDRRVSITNKGNFKITATNSPSPVRVNPDHFERNTTRNLNQSQQQQRQHQRFYNGRSPNNETSLRKNAVSPSISHNSSTNREDRTSVHSRLNYANTAERNNRNSFHNSSRESVVSPSTSFNSTTNKVGLRLPHSNTNQQIQSNATTILNPISASPTNHQSAVSSEVTQNNIPPRTVLNSDFGGDSSVVSSTPITSRKSTPTEQAIRCKRKCAIDTVSEGGIFDFISTVDNNTIIAYAVPLCYTNEFALLNDIDNECQNNCGFAPAVGDLIAVFNNDDKVYVRGIVINIVNNNYNCALIDFGTIVTTTNIRPLPDKFKEIPEFACIVTGSAEDIKEIIKGISKSLNITAPGKLTVTIEETSKNYEVQGKIWDNWTNTANSQVQQVFKVPETKNVLKSGDFVIISSHVDGSLLLRTRECTKLLSAVNQAIRNHKAEAVTETPVINQLVLCPYDDDDGGLHRAEVLSVNGENAKIRYVDYGDSASVKISEFRTVDDTLANISNTYIAITLQEFVNKSFTEKQLQFLEERCSCKEKFRAITQGVAQVFDLLSTDESSLSRKLIELEKPPAPLVVEPVQVANVVTPRQPEREAIQHPPATVAPVNVASAIRPNEDRKIVSDLPICSFKIGLNEAMCTYSGDIAEGAIAFGAGMEEMSNTLLEISELILNQIPKDNKPYKPASMEWCLAMCDGEWFRGVALDDGDENCTVIFVDYGNSGVVKYDNVRKITDKLASYPACAAVCFLQGILKDGSPEVPQQMLTKLQEYLVEYQTYVIDVINMENGVYNITIPTVYKKLKDDGVLN